MLKLFLTIYAGLEHAFEADHLLAVSNLVTHRNNIKQSIKDGIFWGIGHTSTIFFVGILMIFFKFQISPNIFKYLEASVGVMLILLGIYRLFKLLFKERIHAHQHAHHKPHSHHHKAAFGVGLVHGLAGSGALVVLVISQMKSPLDGLSYIFIFGLGSIVGMFLAAFLFSIPFAKNIMKSKNLQIILTIVSSALCIVYGGNVVSVNIFGFDFLHSIF